MAANQMHPCMWCQYPLHQMQTDCPECDQPETPEQEALKDKALEFEKIVERIRTLKLKKMSMDKNRAAKLQATYPSDGEYQPEIELCDAWGNIIVWVVDKKRWDIISLTHWNMYKVCYPRWAYLPQTPDIEL